MSLVELVRKPEPRPANNSSNLSITVESGTTLFVPHLTIKSGQTYTIQSGAFLSTFQLTIESGGAYVVESGGVFDIH